MGNPTITPAQACNQAADLITNLHHESVKLATQSLGHLQNNNQTGLQTDYATNKSLGVAFRTELERIAAGAGVSRVALGQEGNPHYPSDGYPPMVAQTQICSFTFVPTKKVDGDLVLQDGRWEGTARTEKDKQAPFPASATPYEPPAAPPKRRGL